MYHLKTLTKQGLRSIKREVKASKDQAVDFMSESTRNNCQVSIINNFFRLTTFLTLFYLLNYFPYLS